MLPFSSRLNLVLQWLLGVLWIIPCSGRCEHSQLGLCSRHQSWLQHELQLPGSQISGVIAGAGLARKVIAQKHRFHNISSLTTAEDHFYWFSSFTAHPVSPCVVSFGLRVWSVTFCETHDLNTLVLIHLPFLPPWILLGNAWIVLGRLVCCFGRLWGGTSLPRRCSEGVDTAMSFAKDLTAGVEWWKRFPQQKVWSTNSFHMAERMDYISPGSFYVSSPRDYGVNPGRYLEEPHYSE